MSPTANKIFALNYSAAYIQKTNINKSTVTLKGNNTHYGKS